MLRNILERLQNLWKPATPAADSSAASEPTDQDPPPEVSPQVSEQQATEPQTSSSAADIQPDTLPQTPDEIRQQVVEALRTVYDPEIPVSVYELGLIYGVSVDDTGTVDIQMTLTSPGCPVAGILPGQVESAARGVSGVRDARVKLVWDPPWGPDRMSEAAKLELGML